MKSKDIITLLRKRLEQNQERLKNGATIYDYENENTTYRG